MELLKHKQSNLEPDHGERRFGPRHFLHDTRLEPIASWERGGVEVSHASHSPWARRSVKVGSVHGHQPRTSMEGEERTVRIPPSLVRRVITHGAYEDAAVETDFGTETSV
eukprot:scaffold670_cov333-Pavlova_lutheri.AAC.23